MKPQPRLEAKLLNAEVAVSRMTREDIVTNIADMIGRRLANRRALGLKPETKALEAMALVGKMIAEGEL